MISQSERDPKVRLQWSIIGRARREKDEGRDGMRGLESVLCHRASWTCLWTLTDAVPSDTYSTSATESVLDIVPWTL